MVQFVAGLNASRRRAIVFGQHAVHDVELSNAASIEKERLESAEQPVAPRQVGRPTTRAPQDDQLLGEQEILRDHRAYTPGATEPRGHDGQMHQREQEIPHVRVSVGQTSGAAQRCRIRFSARIGNSRPTAEFREAQALLRLHRSGSYRSSGFGGVFAQDEEHRAPVSTNQLTIPKIGQNRMIAEYSPPDQRFCFSPIRTY